MIPLADIFSFSYPPQITWYLLIVIVLLVLSALMSGSETALFSLGPVERDLLKEGKSRRDRVILKLLSDPDRLLATVLIGNNLINICIVILSGIIIDRTIHISGAPVWDFIVKVIIVTFLLLLFGEIMPKITAAYKPLSFSRVVAIPLDLMRWLLKPFAWLLERSGSRVGDHIRSRKENISIDELSDAIEITRNQTDEEKQMLSGIVSFVNTEAAEIMKLRIDMVVLDITADFEEVKHTIIESGFSRIPVFEDNIDDIKGILYVKDMIPYIGEGADFEWRKYLRKPYFVPEHKKINDLLEEFQAQKVHLAIVVDEYGATQGLVSLEDILEEIVGEITDESDAEEQTYYKKLGEGKWLFEGKTHLGDFEDTVGLRDDSVKELSGGAETLAGLLLELNHDFLKKGDTVTACGFKFTVTALDGRRIDKVRVEKTEGDAG